MQSDIRIREIEPIITTESFRTPLKFGASEVRESTSLKVRVRVENRDGKIADGWGQILLSVPWAFPTPTVAYEQRDQAMRELARSICRAVCDEPGFAHPLDHYLSWRPQLEQLAEAVNRHLALDAPLPVLAALVCASPVDAALHDAFGKVNTISAYAGYGREHMSRDLSTYLGGEFQGMYLTDFLRPVYQPEVPVFHLVGGLDKLCESEGMPTDPQDGLPVSLEAWIERDGVYCFKVKLKGTDIQWDVERTAAVAAVAHDTLAAQGRNRFYLSVDSNELCVDPQAVVEYLRKLQEASSLAFRNLLYVEQPTERDLNAHRFDMREVAAIKPVLADEGVTDLRSFDLARELGWSGVALKTCKIHSAALLYMAKATRHRMPYSIQDLTNPGLSLIHSVGFAARTTPIMGVEYNARQYLPWCDSEIQVAHPSLFQVHHGCISTSTIGAFGLGYGVEPQTAPHENPVGT